MASAVTGVGEGRVPYAAAGAAHRATLVRAHAARLGKLQWAVLGEVLAATAAWSKVIDATTCTAITQHVYRLDVEPDGRLRDRVRDALDALAEGGVIGLVR